MSLFRCKCDNNNRFKQIGILIWQLCFFLHHLTARCTLGAILFIYSLARRLNWKLKQQSVRNSILRLGVGFWIFQYKYERERERPVRQKICISNWHWLIIFVINWVLNETVFFQPKRFGGWFHQIWLAEKLDRDWNLWTWFGKTYFVEINLSSVKGSGFEILINWLSALAVVGNSWANFFIKKSEASLNSSGERWQKQFLSGWRGQIQDLYSCASFQNTNTELRKHLTIHITCP